MNLVDIFRNIFLTIGKNIRKYRPLLGSAWKWHRIRRKRFHRHGSIVSILLRRVSTRACQTLCYKLPS